MIQHISSAVLAGSLYFLRSSQFSLSSLPDASLQVRLAVGTASVSVLLLGASFVEHLSASESGEGPFSRTLAFISTFFGHERQRKIVVNNWIDEYNTLHKSDDPNVRNSAYAKLVNSYYELATMFYEWGWGASFHFAYRLPHESFAESMRRHEYYLASHLGLPPGSKVLDVGCGIGGPYRNIARYTGWDITGVTLNEYQVVRGNQLCKQLGLDQQCRSMQVDFMKMDKFASASFDGVYAIEATCHAPDRRVVYGEIMRVLKPGGVFACYEWCLTDKYDGSAAHQWIKKAIEEGDGLPDMARTTEVDQALRHVGFEILTTRDMALDRLQRLPWYLPLTPSWNPFTQRFQFNWLGLQLTTWTLRVLEFMQLAPAGTSKIQTMLQRGGAGCAQGGILGCFTPMYLCVCRKPRK